MTPRCSELGQLVPCESRTAWKVLTHLVALGLFPFQTPRSPTVTPYCQAPSLFLCLHPLPPRQSCHLEQAGVLSYLPVPYPAQVRGHLVVPSGHPLNTDYRATHQYSLVEQSMGLTSASRGAPQGTNPAPLNICRTQDAPSLPSRICKMEVKYCPPRRPLT